DHLYRPRGDLLRPTVHRQGPGSEFDPEGLGADGFRAGIFVVRNPRWIPGRLDGTPPRYPAHRRVVVVLHGGYWLGVELRIPCNDSVSLRRGGSRLFPESH